jgi:hypothetical protein
MELDFNPLLQIRINHSESIQLNRSINNAVLNVCCLFAIGARKAAEVLHANHNPGQESYQSILSKMIRGFNNVIENEELLITGLTERVTLEALDGPIEVPLPATVENLMHYEPERSMRNPQTLGLLLDAMVNRDPNVNEVTRVLSSGAQLRVKFSDDCNCSSRDEEMGGNVEVEELMELEAESDMYPPEAFDNFDRSSEAES